MPPVVGLGGPMTPPPQGDWQALENQLVQVKVADASFRVDHRLETANPVSDIVRVAQETGRTSS